MSLKEVTENLGEEYDAWKEHEKEKNQLREDFFELADQEICKRGLKTQLASIYGEDEEDARKRAAKYYPRHQVVEVNEQDGGDWDVLLEEDPRLQPFSYVNPSDGRLYRRSITSGSLKLDDERLIQDDPGLFYRVTELVGQSFFDGLLAAMDATIVEIREAAEAAGIPHRLKDPADIDAEDLAALQPYLYEGRPTVKLERPRKAKPEELEEDES